MLKVSELFAAVSPIKPTEKELVDVKDLSLDEIMVCLRELAVELDAVQLDFNQQWSVDQLKDELMVLEFQSLLMRQGDSPIPLITSQSATKITQPSYPCSALINPSRIRLRRKVPLRTKQLNQVKD